MRYRREVTAYALVLSFAAWCAYLLRGDLAQLSLAPLLQSWDLVAAATLLSLINYLLRILRWRTYIGRLGQTVGVRFAALTYTAGFAYTLSPGKVGEMVRARYYTPLGMPIPLVAAAFFAERLMDLLAMIVLAALLLGGYPHAQGALLAAIALVVAALASLALLPWAALASRLETFQRIPGVLRRLLAGGAAALAATRALLRPGVIAASFAIGLLAWGLEGIGLGLLSSMFPPLHLDPTTAVGVYGVATLIGGLSFLPGGLGSTEAVMTALIATRGFGIGQALLVTLTCRLVTLWLAVALGWAAVFTLRQKSPAMAAPWR